MASRLPIREGSSRPHRHARAKAAGVAAAVAVTAGLAAPGPAHAAEVVVDKLDGPRQVQIEGNRLHVVQADSGRLSSFRLRTGASLGSPVKGLPTLQGFDVHGSRFYLATGEAEDPSASRLPSSLLSARKGKAPRQLVDFLALELERNPDGQVQFVDDKPVDALSNPFSVTVDHRTGARLVADAGANAVWKVTKRGRTSVFFKPPVITSGACRGAENNPGTTGCDPVPTGITFGPDGHVYVGTLGSERPEAARVYRLHPRTGRVTRTIGGLTGVTGVAVDPRGNVYVSELLHNAPSFDGPPPPGFDPSTVGRIVRIARNGDRATAAVTLPTGLEFHRGRLYASAWSLAGMLGIEDAGQVVRLGRSDFKSE